MGSVVLKSQEWSGLPSEARQYLVVDGQQRITALTLLVCAVRDRIAQLSRTDNERESAVAGHTAQLLRNSNVKLEFVPRLVLQERDQETLSSIIDGDNSVVGTSLLERAYKYMRDRVDGVDRVKLETIIPIILTRFSAVWVTLQEKDNAHRVFQTLNAGGRKLKQSDLVRNYFFLLLGDLGDDFYKDHWRKLESDLRDRQLEDFLVAWSIAQGYTGAKDSLFNYFHKDLRDSEREPPAILKYGMRMTETARYFRWIRQPGDADLGPVAQRSLWDLRNWSTQPAEGLLLWLFRRYGDGRLGERDLGRAFEVVLSFVARRQLAGYEPNLHKSIFVTTTRKLRANDALQGAEIIDYLHMLLSAGEDVRTWPTDELIMARIRTTPIYTSARSGWAFSILERINRQMHDIPKHAPVSIDRAKYSVEHVLPQKLTIEWTRDLHAWGVDNASALHQNRLHVLGNLTLTPINPELSNLPYSKKKAMLSDDSLKINVQLSSADSWTEASINERSGTLGVMACASFLAPLESHALSQARGKFGWEDSIAKDVGDVLIELEDMGG